MRETYGGVFMIIIFMITLVLVVAFAAIGLAIGKGYKVKNQIISYIEQYQGCVEKSSIYVEDGYEIGNCTLRGDKNNLIANYLNSVGYNNDEYTVYYYNVSDKCSNCSYYEVIVNVGWYIPFINSSKSNGLSANYDEGQSGTFEIRGKTDLIRE